MAHLSCQDLAALRGSAMNSQVSGTPHLQDLAALGSPAALVLAPSPEHSLPRWVGEEGFGAGAEGAALNQTEVTGGLCAANYIPKPFPYPTDIKI